MRNITTITIRKAPTSPPGRLIKKCSISSSPPNPLNTSENKEAPTKIMKIIEVILTDSRATKVSIENDNLSLIEDGGHVRIGYSEKDCYSVCEGSGLEIEKIEYCSGFFSQKITSMIRFLNLILPYPLIWGITFPLRSLPIIFDA